MARESMLGLYYRSCPLVNRFHDKSSAEQDRGVAEPPKDPVAQGAVAPGGAVGQAAAYGAQFPGGEHDPRRVVRPHGLLSSRA